MAVRFEIVNVNRSVPQNEPGIADSRLLLCLDTGPECLLVFIVSLDDRCFCLSGVVSASPGFEKSPEVRA